MEDILQPTIESLTPNYGLGFGSPQIMTDCNVIRQVLLSRRRNLRGRKSTFNWRSLWSRKQSDDILTIEYIISYQSVFTNLAGYDLLYRDYMNGNDNDGVSGNEILTETLNANGIEVISSEPVFINFQTDPPTPAPTTSRLPTFLPTPAPSSEPTSVPLNGAGGSSDNTTAAIAGAVVSAVVLALLGGGYYLYRTRQRNKRPAFEEPRRYDTRLVNSNNDSRSSSRNDNFISNNGSELSYEAGIPMKAPSSIADSSLYSGLGVDSVNSSNHPPSPTRRLTGSHDELDNINHQSDVQASADLSYIQEIPHEESMLSNESLLSMTGQSLEDNSPVFASNGNGIITDDDELMQLADEFDLYKDHSLERMRAAVGDFVSGSDDMMSEALTKALMEDEDIEGNIDVMWGGVKESMEIEASVLCDVFDWIKRQERLNLDMKRAYMQDIMNKMVSAVRYNLIGPDDASRTIHGCAALLGMGLAEDLPESAIIITGMPKTVTDRNTLIATFRQFGEIDNAAMASKARGFGLVRFRWSKSVNAVMQKHRHGEIVVQDVAVTVRVLKPDMKDAASEV